MFRVGDIVEVQSSVVFIKTKNGPARMKTVLRAIALMNCEHTMVRDKYIQNKHMRSMVFIFTQHVDREKKREVAAGSSGPKAALKLKRKIGFEEDNVELRDEAGKRARNMDVVDDRGDMSS